MAAFEKAPCRSASTPSRSNAIRIVGSGVAFGPTWSPQRVAARTVESYCQKEYEQNLVCGDLQAELQHRLCGDAGQTCNGASANPHRGGVVHVKHDAAANASDQEP